MLRAAPPSRRADVDRGHAIANLDRIDDFHACRDLAEMVVDTAGGEKRRVTGRDEELRSSHAGRARGHPDGSARPLGRVGFVGELVRGPAGAVGQRIPALDDESRHHPMTREAVVEVVLRQVDEVVDRLRGHTWVNECDREITPRRVHRRSVFLGRVDDGGRGRGSLFHAGDNLIVAARGGRGRPCGIGARAHRDGCNQAGQHAFHHVEIYRNQREGSRAPSAITNASSIASPAVTASASRTLLDAAIPPPISGPRKNPNATALALNPKIVLCASIGVSSPIIAAVPGTTAPYRSPVAPTAITTTTVLGATTRTATAMASNMDAIVSAFT